MPSPRRQRDEDGLYASAKFVNRRIRQRYSQKVVARRRAPSWRPSSIATATSPVTLRSANEMLDSGRDAVRQWTFTPTTINGVPVSVLLTVTVSFNLGI
jgi:hypothetical protein